MPPGVKNISWRALAGYGGTLEANHSSGMSWWLDTKEQRQEHERQVRMGEKPEPIPKWELIEVPSNPVESTWGVSEWDYTFRADFVRDAFIRAGLQPTAAFAQEYFATAWVRAEAPGDPAEAGDPDNPDEQPPDFQAPDPPNQDPDQPPDFQAPDPPNQDPDQPPDFPAPDPPGGREGGPGGE